MTLFINWCGAPDDAFNGISISYPIMFDEYVT